MTSQFVDRLRAVATDTPNALALVNGTDTCSYLELWNAGCALATELLEAGVRTGTLVGLHQPKSFEFVVGILGTWLAGAAFVPMDLGNPKQRLQRIASETGMTHLIAASGELGESESWVGEIHVIENDWRPSSLGIALETPPEVACSPADTAYVLYTSGSSGRPKGVRVPHRGLVNLLDEQIAAFGLGPSSRSLWLLSPSFDASLSDIGTTLLAGGALHLPPPGSVSVGQLLEVLAAEQITHLDLPPALLARIDHDRVPSNLETIIIGGEVCPPDVVRQWAGTLRVVNVYGPTETTICASLVRCDPTRWTVPLIGQPIANVSFEVRRADGTLSKTGELGELFIGGIGLADGYLNQPELSAAKFIGVGSERRFRTGDLVKRHPGGELEFVGRIDRQCKINGALVAPEEIESRLVLHPAIEAAAVVALRARHQSTLCAYYSGNVPLSHEEIRTHLQSHLPSHLVPTRFEFVAEFPRTTTGKIDFRRLAEVAEVADVETTVSLRDKRAMTALERTLAQSWAVVLEASEVCELGAEANFFDLGGDSLAAIELVVHAASLGISLTAEQIYKHPILQDLAEVLSNRSNEGSKPPAAYATTNELCSDPIFEASWHVAPSMLDDSSDTGSSFHPGQGSDHGDIVLTGATGFLGSALIPELLARRRGQIICLVRARNDAHARERVLSAFVDSGEVGSGPISNGRDRIEALAADLTDERLGLSPERFDRLAIRASVIVHCAAKVNLVSPYDELRETNVVGTWRMLNLAHAANARRRRLGKTTSFHLASTLSVFVGSDRNTGTISEDDNLDEVGGLHGGYAQSKWVAERLVRDAAGSGVGPVSIYRLGLLTGPTTNGEAADNDWLSLFTRGLVSVGSIPALLAPGFRSREANDSETTLKSVRVDVTPLDYAAAAMAHIAMRKTSNPDVAEVFHIANPQSVGLGEILAAIERTGSRLEVVSTGEWLQRAASKSNRPEVAAAVLGLGRALSRDSADCTEIEPAFRTIYERARPFDVFQATGTRFATSNTEAVLSGSGIGCARADAKLLDLYLERMLAAE